jgi:hypothetical protein
MFNFDLIERLMLVLGTSFSRFEIIKLLENPFMKKYFPEWTFEKINKV